MRQIKKMFLGVMALSSLAMVGCGSSSLTGMPSIANGLQLPAGTNALLSVYVDTAPTGTAKSLAIGESVDLTTALIGISEIDLKKVESSEVEEDGEIELAGPFVVNLIDGTAENCGSSHIDSITDETEILDAIELVPGTYQEVELKLDKIEEGDNCNNQTLLNKSLLVEGTIDGQSFRIEGNFDDEFSQEDSNGIVVDDSSIASFILSFDLSCWFEGIDLTGAETVDGVVVIDQETNPTLLEQFRDRIKACTDLEGDEDGDGIPNNDD